MQAATGTDLSKGTANHGRGGEALPASSRRLPFQEVTTSAGGGREWREKMRASRLPHEGHGKLQEEDHEEDGYQDQGVDVRVTEQEEDESEGGKPAPPVPVTGAEEEQEQNTDRIVAGDDRPFVREEIAQRQYDAKRPGEGRVAEQDEDRGPGDQRVERLHPRGVPAEMSEGPYQQVPDARVPLVFDQREDLRRRGGIPRQEPGHHLVAPHLVMGDDGAQCGRERERQYGGGGRGRAGPLPPARQTGPRGGRARRVVPPPAPG